MVDGLTQRQAYYKAFPHSKKWKENTVDSRASELFAQSKIQGRFLELTKKVSESLEISTIASKQEVLEFLTRLMRKEESEQALGNIKRKDVWYDEEGRRLEKSTSDPVVVTLDTKNADAFKGAEALAKHYGVLSGLAEDKSDNITIINDLGDLDEH